MYVNAGKCFEKDKKGLDLVTGPPSFRGARFQQMFSVKLSLGAGFLFRVFYGCEISS